MMSRGRFAAAVSYNMSGTMLILKSLITIKYETATDADYPGMVAMKIMLIFA